MPAVQSLGAQTNSAPQQKKSTGQTKSNKGAGTSNKSAAKGQTGKSNQGNGSKNSKGINQQDKTTLSKGAQKSGQGKKADSTKGQSSKGQAQKNGKGQDKKGTEDLKKNLSNLTQQANGNSAKGAEKNKPDNKNSSKAANQGLQLGHQIGQRNGADNGLKLGWDKNSSGATKLNNFQNNNSQQSGQAGQTGQTGQAGQVQRGDVNSYDAAFRQAMVDNSYAMNDKMQNGGISFNSDMNNQQYNPEYWQQTNIDGNSMWQVKDGVNPSAAISDVFDSSGGNYGFDCAAATNLVSLKSTLDTIGAEDFNNQFSGLAVRGWDTYTNSGGMDHDGGLDRSSGSTSERGSTGSLSPGDWAYFKNPGVDSGPSQGENAIYLGNNQFFGVPVGIISGEDNSYGYLSSLQGSADPSRLAAMDVSPY